MRSAENMSLEAKTVWRGIVRKRHYEFRTLEEVVQMLASLSGTNYTGKLQINMSQGSFQGVDTEDHAQIKAENPALVVPRQRVSA